MKTSLALLWMLLILSSLWLPAARAVDSEPPFSDPALQQRYENLIQNFRCLVCQDESIANSDASLAADFRRQIHTMVAAGQSDQQIRQFMVTRYGDFVLYKPPLQANTWLLWLGPFLLLLLAIAAVLRVVYRRARMDNAERTSP